MKTLSKIKFISLLIIGFAACNDDDGDLQVSSGNILMSTRLPNAGDATTGSGYMQLISNIDEAGYDNSSAFPTTFSIPPIVIGEDVFVLPGLTSETDVMKKYSLVDGELKLQGTLTLASQSGAIGIVAKGNTAYISCSSIGKITVINHKTMTEIENIDITSYGVGDQNPDPAMMLIRGNLLYVGLNQIVGGSVPDPTRPYSDVLIINTETNSPVKMITSEAGFSMPTNGMGDPNSFFVDEDGDIYLSCLAGLGYIGHKAGFLRIKADETEFDNSYSFCVSDKTIDGIDYNLDCLRDMQYVGNGIVYAAASVSGYYSSTPDYLADRVVMALKLDLVEKTIEKLDIPKGSIYGTAVGMYDNHILFGFATDNDNGFYTYNISTGNVSSSAVITTTGYPYGLKTLEK